MIKIIIRKFINEHKNIENIDVREAYGVLAGKLGIFCNALLFIIKIIIGVLMNSIAVISDAFNNLSDMGTSLVVIFGIKMSNAKPDTEHPFGHGRIEYISSLIVSFIVLLVGIELTKNSIIKIVNPEVINYNPLLIIMLILSMLVKVWMFVYNNYIGNLINSTINKATAIDSLNDVIATGSVVLSIIVQYYFKLQIDGYVGLLVSLLIIFTGLKIFKDTVDILLGKSPSEETVDKICGFFKDKNYIIGMHDLRIHDYGPGRSIGSVHVELLNSLDLIKAHEIVDNIEKDIYAQTGIDIVIHVDPVDKNI